MLQVVQQSWIHTVDPADSQRLEDGEKQQAGSTAGEVVIDLEHIETTLSEVETYGEDREKTTTNMTPLFHVMEKKQLTESMGVLFL